MYLNYNANTIHNFLNKINLNCLKNLNFLFLQWKIEYTKKYENYQNH